MSTNRNVANLSITVVKTLVKMAGFGFAADMIDGAQECLNLLADIKNDALGNPNAEMIRSLNGAVKSELDAIQDALKHDGLGGKQVKQAAAQLAEAARETIKALAEDDDALIRAVQQPERFAQELRAHAAPLPDLSGDEMQAHYETILDQIAEEFHTLAPWSPNFDRVAFADLLRCFPALTDQVAQLERTMNVRFDNVDEGQRKIIKLLETRPAVAIKPEVFGSRPEVVTDDRFVKRDEHEQLNALVTDTTTRRTVLVGMRGCGKTQLAATLAKQCEEANWNLVAWINAVSPDTIQSDLVELAKRLKIDTSDQPAQDVIVRRCLDHLKSAAPTDRLIVFDNVEDINHLIGHIPSGEGVRVVATTTNKVGWEDQGWNSIKVGVFDRNTSIEYLLTVTNSDNRDAADALAERLGDLPLAIAQAAATARHKDLSLARYLKRLKSRGEELVIRPIPGDEYTDDVATVLRMAVEAAVDSMKNGTKQMARRQLGALALLAESGVPTRWLDPTVEQLDDDESPDTQRDTDEDAHDALTELIHRSIVQQTARDRSKTTIHRLQAQVLRNSWNNNELDDARAAATGLLGSVNISRYPSNDTKARRQEALDLVDQLRSIGTQEHSQVLFESPHTSEALFQTFSHASDLGLPYEALTLDVAVDALAGLLGPDHPDTLTSRNNLAGAYESAGRLNEAITLYEQVLTDRIRVLGEDHPDTLTSRNNLAGAYRAAGRLTEAITLYEQVLHDRIRVLSEDHPDTLTSRNNLAYAYESAGRLTEAITLYEQVLTDRIRILGEDHPDTLTSRNNLAGAYRAAGRLTEAIALYEQVTKDCARILGEDHPNTLTSRNNLAGAYESAGRLNEAITLYEQVLTDRIRVLGEDHPDTLTSRNNLAGAYRAAGRLTEAIALYEQVTKDCARILGEDHPNTLTSRNNLAGAYESAGRLNEAITLYEQVLTDRIRVLGEDHPDTLTSRNNLAGAYRAAGRLTEAITLYEQVLHDRIRVLSEDHPNTLASRNNLAYAYESAGRLNEAITLYEQVLHDSIRVLGEDHPNTLSSRNHLAYAYNSAGRLTEAIILYEQVLTDSIRIRGEDHPYTLSSRNHLAAAYNSAGRLTEAITLYEQVLTDRIRILGNNHPDTLASRNNLACAYVSVGRLAEAITLLEQVLTDSIRILGEDHPDTLSSRNNLAYVYKSAGRLAEAISLNEQVLTDRIRILGNDHPDTLTSRNNLAYAYHSVGCFAQAIALNEQVLTDRIRILGNDHPDTLASRNNLAGTYWRSGRLDEAIQLFEQTLHDSIRVLCGAHPFTATVRENLEAAKRELEQQAEDSANEEREQED